MYNIEAVKKACIAKMSGLETYKYIMDNFKSIDLSGDDDNAKEFRTKYRGYYRVRRNDDWSKLYFGFFENNKNNNDITFNQIIDYCYNNMKTNKGAKNPVEASFSSKMLATINPEKPILDSRVLENMGLTIPVYLKSDKKLERAKAVYEIIDDRYKAYSRTPESDTVVSIFNEMFPDYTELTKTKKIDFFLWALDKKDLKKINLFGDLLNG